MLLTLEDRLTRLTLAPHLGAGLVNWQTHDGLPLLRHWSAPLETAESPRQLGCFPLVPWSNRIHPPRIDNPDHPVSLAPWPADSEYPTHGTGWHQPWRLVSQRPGQILLQLDSPIPFPYQARLRIELQDGCLSQQLSVEHQGDAPAWYGLGFHPYLTRTPDTRLQVTGTRVWDEPGQRLPRTCRPIPTEWDFTRSRPLPETLIDHAFEGWDGQARILEPGLGYRLDCSSQSSRFILFTPCNKKFFCLEPVTHPINAHHLPERPGLHCLAPGQRLELDWIMRYRPL